MGGPRATQTISSLDLENPSEKNSKLLAISSQVRLSRTLAPDSLSSKWQVGRAKWGHSRPLLSFTYMAVAFVDDSGSGGDAPYFVLAGYVASEAAWNKFVTDWQAVLDLSPKLEYFKMKEAEGLRGQFASFTPPQRDSRLHLFIDVILQCDPWEASISVPAKDHYEVLYPILPKTRSSPYYSAFIAMVTALSGFYRWSGSDETVDYIFDQQPGIENRAASLYFNFRTWRPEWRLGRVGFADEKKVLPCRPQTSSPGRHEDLCVQRKGLATLLNAFIPSDLRSEKLLSGGIWKTPPTPS